MEGRGSTKGNAERTLLAPDTEPGKRMGLSYVCEMQLDPELGTWKLASWPYRGNRLTDKPRTCAALSFELLGEELTSFAPVVGAGRLPGCLSVRSAGK